jgi:DNA-binding MarR family transcriptional regulator
MARSSLRSPTRSNSAPTAKPSCSSRYAPETSTRPPAAHAAPGTAAAHGLQPDCQINTGRGRDIPDTKIEEQPAMPARKTTPQHAIEADPHARPDAPQQIDDERKRLMAAILEFSALIRRGEPTDSSRLALGRAMQKHGLEQRHASALLTIALYGPMTITQLAGRHHVTLKTASLIAVQLEQAGLIQRREDPTDRRRTIVTIAKGKERAIGEGLNNRAAHLDRTLNRLTPQQREGLVIGLETLTEEMARSRG